MASMQANGNSFEEWDAAVRGEEQREQRAVGESKSPFAAVFAFSRLTGNREGGSEEATATEMVKSPPEKLPVEDKNMAQLLPLPCAPVEVDDEAYLDPPATGTEEIEAQNAVGGCDSAHAGCDCEELTGCGGCGESFSGSEWVAMQTIPGVCNEHPGWCGNCVDQACSQEEGCSPRGCGGPTACSCGFNAENADETLPPCFGCGSVCHLHCQGMFVPGFGSGGGVEVEVGGGGLCIGGRRAGYSKRGTWVSASGAVLFSLTGVLLFMDRFTPQKMSTMTPPLTFATGVMGRWPPVVRAAARLSE